MALPPLSPYVRPGGGFLIPVSRAVAISLTMPSRWDPMLAPAALIVCGLAATWLAVSLRRRATRRSHAGRPATPGVGRAVLLGYVVIALSTFALAGVEIVQRGSVFWDARWDDHGTLVLERWGPIPDVRLEKEQVATITEFSNRERNMSGRRRVVRFMLQTRVGESHWSAPMARPNDVASMRELLIVATDRRLSRFTVGNPASD